MQPKPAPRGTKVYASGTAKPTLVSVQRIGVGPLAQPRVRNLGYSTKDFYDPSARQFVEVGDR